MQKIIIVGNSISADIMYAYLKQDDRYHIVAFSADQKYINTLEKFNLPTVALEYLFNTFSPKNYKIILAIGYKKINQVRASLFDRVKKMGYTLETYIHPDASVFNHDKIGEGSIIMAGSVIEPYVKIGKDTVIWGNCLIGHHTTVGDNCWIASGTVLAGQTNIGNNCFLGVGVSVSNQVNVGAFSIIGGNTAIHKDTKENEVYLSHQGEKHRFSAEDYDEHFLK